MKLSVLTSLVFLMVGSAYAQETPASSPPPAATEAPKEEKEVKLKPATLASSGHYSSRGSSVDQATDGTVAGDETMAISASVAKISSGKCQVVVRNSDEESGYSVNIDVVITTRDGTGFGKKKNFSGTVAAKGKMERDFSCDAATDNFQVNLKSGKRLKPKKKE